MNIDHCGNSNLYRVNPEIVMCASCRSLFEDSTQQLPTFAPMATAEVEAARNERLWVSHDPENERLYWRPNPAFAHRRDANIMICPPRRAQKGAKLVNAAAWMQLEASPETDKAWWERLLGASYTAAEVEAAGVQWETLTTAPAGATFAGLSLSYAPTGHLHVTATYTKGLIVDKVRARCCGSDEHYPAELAALLVGGRGE